MTIAPWEQYEQGAVEVVVEEQYGSVLAADAPIGSTTLVVDDVIDFEEGGGQLSIGEELITYVATDDDTSTIELADVTTVAYVIDDPVWVYPDTRERRAQVRLDVDGETVDARVPHALFDRLAEGTRQLNEFESVGLKLDGDEWVVDDVLGVQPLIDGSYIDPDTMPPAPPHVSDGNPPAGIPALELTPLGIGALRAEWTAMINADEVSYDLHVSATSPFTPNSTTLYLTVTAQNFATIAQLPDGTPLIPGQMYFAIVIPYDEDGDGQPSAEASGTPRQITNADFNGENVYAMKVEAQSIQSGEMTADIIIGGTFKTAESGQRVEISGADGLVNYGPDEVPRVILPTGGTDPAVLRGVAEVDTLTVHGPAEFQEGAHVSKGEDFVLESKVQAPIAQPELTMKYAEVPLHVDAYSAPTNRYGVCFVNDQWWSVNEFFGAALRSYHKTTGALMGVLALKASNGNPNDTINYPDAQHSYGGLTRIGGYWFVLGPRQSDNQWQIRKYGDDGVEVARAVFTGLAGVTTDAAIGSANIAGVDTLIIAKATAAGVCNIYHHRASDCAYVTSFGTSGGGNIGANNVAGVALGNFDVGSTMYAVVTKQLGNNHVTMFYESTKAYSPQRSFLTGGINVSGMCWDGTKFNVLNYSTAALRQYNSIRADIPNSDTYSLAAAATYADSVHGYETVRGAARTITINKRAGFRASIATMPTGVDSVRFHLSEAGGGFAPAATQPAVGVLSKDYSSLATSGTTPTSSTFPNEVSARFMAGPIVLLEGDGFGTFATGDIKMSAGAYAGGGVPIIAGGTWLLCDNSLVDKTVFAALFNVIGHTFNNGVDPGGNKFYLPSMAGRAPIGAGVSGFGTYAVGAAGGAAQVTLTINNLPSHSHGLRMRDAAGTQVGQVAGAGGASALSNNTGVEAYGNSLPFNNMPPYRAVNFLIKT